MPVYFRQTHAFSFWPDPDAIFLFDMMYLIRGSWESSRACATFSESRPCAGSFVKSRAHTIPAAVGLWSEVRAEWFASPMDPSEALLRPGYLLLICLSS